MKIQEAIAIQRKMLEGTQKQHDAEQDPRKKLTLHNRIRSLYVSMACMALMEGTGIEDKIDPERINGTGVA